MVDLSTIIRSDSEKQRSEIIFILGNNNLNSNSKQMSRLYRTLDYHIVWLGQWGSTGTRPLVVLFNDSGAPVYKQLEWGEKSSWLWEKIKVNRLIGYRSPHTCCVQTRCQHWARTCGQETHIHLLQADRLPWTCSWMDQMWSRTTWIYVVLCQRAHVCVQY